MVVEEKPLVRTIITVSGKAVAKIDPECLERSSKVRIMKPSFLSLPHLFGTDQS